jgi:hypothetical protein
VGSPIFGHDAAAYFKRRKVEALMEVESDRFSRLTESIFGITMANKLLRLCGDPLSPSAALVPLFFH